MEVKNIFMTYSYNMQNKKEVSVILNWVAREGLHLMQPLNDEDKKCKTSMRLFEILSKNFSHNTKNNIILQYCILTREQSGNAEEWSGHLRRKVNECKYIGKDRRLKNQFLIAKQL